MKYNMDSARYGNWVSMGLIRKVIVVFFLLLIPCVFLWIGLPGWLPLKIILTFLAALTFIFALYLCTVRYIFSTKGGDIQNKILELLLSRTELNGKNALDIGCGSAALTIKLAKKYPDIQVTGIDYWGGPWGYSKKICEENSNIEGVASRTEFIQASASELPFDDDSFDLVVSNMTFHEVKDSNNKYDVVKEALRVVKKGGYFVFQDLFLFHFYYPDIEEFMLILKNSGIDNIHFIDTSKSPFIPKLLKLPFMVGTIGILYGTK